MMIWFDLYHGEKKGLEGKKKDSIWQEAPKNYRLFSPLAWCAAENKSRAGGAGPTLSAFYKWADKFEHCSHKEVHGAHFLLQVQHPS